MKIIHRISISTTRAIQKELDRLGVVAGEGFVTFEVDEADERWPGVSEWVVRRHAPDFVSTKFSAAETADANWLEVVPTWHHGYPQPEDEYMAATYDLTDYCPECGIGAKQNAPFCMKSEPRWGRNGIATIGSSMSTLPRRRFGMRSLSRAESVAEMCSMPGKGN
jgi:hypothetical protein